MATAIVAHLLGDGNSDAYGTINWGTIFGGPSITVARKLFVQNVGDEAATLTAALAQTGTSDFYGYLDWQHDPGTPGSGGTVVSPWNLVASLVTSGGSMIPTVTYYYKVTARTGSDKPTAGSVEAASTITSGSTNSVVLTWTDSPGAVSYDIYRTTTGGGTYTSGWIGETTGVSFIDTGLTPGSGTLPTFNLTAGSGSPNYCDSPPTTGWTTSPLAFGSIQPGQQKVYWIRASVPGTVSEDGNPRSAQIDFTRTA